MRDQSTAKVLSMARWVTQTMVLVTVLSSLPSITLADALCGNGVVEAGEDCDDGGTCIGGSNAGTHCTKESDCIGNGMCVGGMKPWTACADDSTCPGGRCQHCIPHGGDGCAANCTTETDVPYPLIPGRLDGLTLVPKTSGVTTTSDFISVPLPLTGFCNSGDNATQPCLADQGCSGGTCVPSQETLTIGKEHNGKIPVVVKADSVRFTGIIVSTGACGCIRGVAAKTCGGTIYESDGVTPTTDCTSGYSVGESLCIATGKACSFVHGEGNTASGEIGCDGLDNINVTFSQDSGGASGVAGPPMVVTGGSGGPGSASVLSTLGITSVLGNCTGTDTSTYGPDGIYCTPDDPIGGIIAIDATSPAVTGTATAVVLRANGIDDHDVGPVTVTGAPFSCAALAEGSAAGAGLVQASGFVHLETVGDVVLSGQFFASTPLPATPTPTLPPTGTCVGDCSDDSTVTIDELITMVNIALSGESSARVCPGVDLWCSGPPGVTLDCIIVAVNNALDDCGISGLGGPCGGNLEPRECAPGLVCQVGDVPDVPGTCVIGPTPTATPTPPPTPNTCGQFLNNPCCSDGTCFVPDTVCMAGLCVWCGENGQPCCGTRCIDAVSDCIDGTCRRVRTPIPTPTPTPTPACAFECVGGCCDFGGARQCYQLVNGSDAAQCIVNDHGNVVGCCGGVTCNPTTGRCESQ